MYIIDGNSQLCINLFLLLGDLFIYLFIYVEVFFVVYACTNTCMLGAHGGQKKALARRLPS